MVLGGRSGNWKYPRRWHRGTRAEGRAEEIIETGYEFGLSDDDILGRLQRKLGISMEMAQGYLRRFGKSDAKMAKCQCSEALTLSSIP